MADPIKTPQQVAEQVWQAMQAQQTTPPVVNPQVTAPAVPQNQPTQTQQPSQSQNDNVLNLWNGKVVLKNSPKYKALIDAGYTDEKIVQELSKKQSKIQPSWQSIQPQQETQQTAQVAQGEKPNTQQNQVVQQPQEQQLPDFQDNSQPRQQEIVDNLNKYYQSNPSMFQDRNLFEQSFSYSSRSDLQKSILDNWYKTNVEKVNQVNNLSRQLPSDIAISYSSGKIWDAEMNILKNTDPVKYAQAQDQIEKTKLFDKYSKLLYWEEEVKKDDPIQWIIKQMDTLITNNNSTTMYEDYQKAMNAPDMIQLQSDLAVSDGKIKEIDNQINATKSELEAQFKWSGISQGRINAMIQDQTQLLQNQRNTEAINYQTISNKYQSRLDTIKTNLEAQEKQYALKQQQDDNVMKKLSFSYQIYSDVKKTEDAKRASDLEYLRDIEKMNIQQELSFNQAVRLDKLENWDINNADPYIVNKAVQKNVDQLMQQYDWLITSTRDQLVTRIQDWLKSGKSYGQVQWEIMQDIKNKPEYELWRNNKLGIDTKPVQVADGLYYQNWQLLTENWLRSKYGISSVEQEAIQKQVNALRMNWGYSQYDNPEAVAGILQDQWLWLWVNCWVQCAWYTSLVYKKLTWQDIAFGSTLDSKINTIQKIWVSPVPVVWGFVALDTKNGGYGHTWFVTAVSSDGKKVQVLNSNYNGTAKNPNNTVTQNWFDISSVKASSIAVGKQAPWSQSQNTQYDMSLSALYKKMNEGKLTKEDYAQINGIGISTKSFAGQALQYKQDQIAKWWQDALSAIDYLINNYPWRVQAMASDTSVWKLSSWLADFNSKYNFIRSKLSMDALVSLKDQWATFGALSDSERQAIGDSISALNLSNSEQEFKANLEKARNMIYRAMWQQPQQQNTNPFQFWLGSTTWNSYLQSLSIFN